LTLPEVRRLIYSQLSAKDADRTLPPLPKALRLLGRLQGENRDRVNRKWTQQVRKGEEVIRSGGGLPGDDQEEAREKRA
jgi:hypothetical protein